VTLTLLTDRFFVTGCYASYVKYDELSRAVEGSDGETSRPHYKNVILNRAQEELDHLLHMKVTWLVFLVISAVLLGIILLVLIYLRSRIRIAIALIKEASK
jgi:choline transporter-like protein 2/4/5